MKKKFRDLSIRVKLILLMLLTASIVLAMTAGAFLTLEVRSESREVEEELSSLAEVIGFNCRAALVFGDRGAAEKTLDALKLRPHILSAWILTPAEELFARYERQPAGKPRSVAVAPPRPAVQSLPRDLVTSGGERHWLEDGSLLLRLPVILDDELVGILVLHADLGELQTRMRAFSSALVAVLVFSCLFALLLASWLQRFISRPIVEMTDLMGEVSREKNYGLRLARQSEDEVGQLVSGFNEMLEQIEVRDHRLEEANNSLEHRVAARTEELSRANADLARLLEEYRQAETSLRQSEEKYRSLFENSPISFWEQDFSQVLDHFESLRREGVEDFAAFFAEHPGEIARCAALARILDVNRKTLKLFGAADKQAFFAGLEQIFTERSVAAIRDILVALAEGRQTYETEGINRTLAGEERNFLIRYSVLPAESKADGRLLVSLLDITDRKRAEEALRQGESRFRSLFENSPISLWEEDFSAVKLYLDNLKRSGVEDFAAYFELRPDALSECARLIRVLDVNQATVRLFGAVDKAELFGHLERVFTEESYVQFREEMVALAQGQTSIQVEGVNQTLDGERRFVNMRLSVVPGQEETWAEVIVSLVDLTERRATEDALRQSETRFRQMVDLLPQTIFEADAGGRLTFANRAGLQTFGYEPEDLAAGLRVLDVIAPAERQEALPNLLRVLQGEVVGPVERTLMCKDGRTFPALIHAGPIMQGFEPVGMRGLIIDISERRHAEEALRMLGKALETTRVGVTIANMQGEIIYTNPAEASMHGYTIDELLGQSANILGPPERRSSYPLAYLQTSQRESVNRHKDGSLFPVRLVSDLVTDGAGDPLAVVTVCEDITERKEAEARLKASLAEKDVLLKEVHHRVKNNMQIISSLLNLQLKKITDTRTRAELNATRNRIRSMGLIHARLYQSQDLTRINFAEYIEEFSRQLASLYDLDPKRIRMALDIDAVFLEVDVAIPCGMIVNELLTNALKYAFPGERTGEVAVRLRADGERMVLSVADDGVGMPPDIDLDRVETLGLQLVRGLAQQIGGTVTIDRNGGTRVQIRIPLAGNAGLAGDGTSSKQ